MAPSPYLPRLSWLHQPPSARHPCQPRGSAASAVYARLFKFTLCSLGLHLAVFWPFWWSDSFEHGAVQGANVPGRALQVRLVANVAALQPAPPQPQGSKSAAEPAPPMEKTPSPAAPGIAAAAGAPQAEAGQDYLPGGQLTRLPEPKAPIDLSVPEISGLGFAGKVAVTILIDADGTVAGVIADTDEDQARAFTDLVVARFRQARFMPGEVNGKAVRSKLQATVVSELPAAEEAQ